LYLGWSYIALLFAVPLCAQSEPAQAKPYEEVFYSSDGLRIQAYLYKPEGEGPFPVVIYNHGSREGHERSPTPFVFIGQMLAARGYVVLVPERRGYGLSEGEEYIRAVDHDYGEKFVERLQQETDDVLASLDYLKTIKQADTNRTAVMGWSLGGIVSVFAAGRSPVFRAVIDQAGAALTWDRSPAIQKALRKAAGQVHVPVLALDAQNDRTTEAVKAVVHEVEKQKIPAKLIIYPPFTPPAGASPDIAPGHLIFTSAGAHIWENDVTSFLAENLAK
jgi:dienelactone hydrolase